MNVYTDMYKSLGDYLIVLATCAVFVNGLDLRIKYRISRSAD